MGCLLTGGEQAVRQAFVRSGRQAVRQAASSVFVQESGEVGWGGVGWGGVGWGGGGWAGGRALT
jgi:hypothetical protein